MVIADSAFILLTTRLKQVAATTQHNNTVVQSMTLKGYDNMEANWVSVRSSVSRSLDDLITTRSVISESTNERSKEDRQVVYPSEITMSWFKVKIAISS